MTRRVNDPTTTMPAARRRRGPRPLSLLPTLPEDRTAEAMDDELAAQELIEDLLALVEAGVIAPMQQYGDDIRYAPADPDNPAA